MLEDIKMKNSNTIAHLILTSSIGLISLLLIACLPSISGDNKSDINNTDPATNTPQTQNCGGTFSTSDLNGCFQPQNSGTLEYYCFDGFGNYYYESWNVLSGCSGQLDGGNYQVQGCTLTVCDSKGCDEYTAEPSGEGLLVDGEYYAESGTCS